MNLPIAADGSPASATVSATHRPRIPSRDCALGIGVAPGTPVPYVYIFRMQNIIAAMILAGRKRALRSTPPTPQLKGRR